MISIKQAIYETLNNDSSIHGMVGNQIHTWADDKDIRDTSDDIFPMITYYRVKQSKIRNGVGIRTEVFQISAWSETMLNAENISRTIVEVFNRTMNSSWKSCSLLGVSDSHDPHTKTHGIHASFAFVVYDPAY